MHLRLLIVALAACFAALWFSPAALAFGDCANTAYMQTFDERLTTTTCDVVGTVDIRWSGGSAHMRVVKPHGSPSDLDSAMMGRARELAARVGAAMDQIGNVSIADVTVFLTDLRPPDGELAHTDVQRRPGLARECAIAFYKQRAGMRVEEFVFTYAHELYHCVQFRTWPAQMAAAAASNAWWWVEGSAEYFAHLAQPGTGESDGFVQQFDTRSPTDSILEMDYQNLVFFSWLGQTQGPSAVGSFSRSMATGGGGGAQLAALQSAVPSDKWLDFEKAYLDRRITLPGGRAFVTTPATGAKTDIYTSTERPIPIRPYVVARETLVFKRGHKYLITFSGRPDDVRIQWAKAQGSDWATPPTEVDPCDGDETFRVVWGSTRSSSGGTMKVRAQEHRTVCNCLVGTWQMSSATLLNNVKQTFCRSAQSCSSGGNLILTFNGDVDATSASTGTYTYGAVTVDATMPPRSAVASFTKRLDGTAHTRWHTVQNVLFLAFSDLFRQIGVINTRTTMRDGRVTTKSEPITAGVGLGPFLGGRYDCHGNALHIGAPPGYQMGDAYSFDFTRISGAPPGRH